MATRHKIYRTKDGAFEYGFVGSPKEMYGTLTPFRRHWWAQYLGDGTQRRFDTKQECLDWIEGWKEIAK